MHLPAIIIHGPHMKERALRARSTLIDEHIRVDRDYPISEALRSTSMWPTNEAALRMLLRRGVLTVRNGLLSNAIGTAVEALFRPIVNENDFEIAVQFPQPIVVASSFDATRLALSLTTPIPVTFISKPIVDGATLLPDSVLLIEFAITNTAMVFTFANVGEATPALLLVTQFEPTDKAALMAEVKAVSTRFASYAILVVGSGFCGGPAPPPAPITSVLGTWTGIAANDSGGSSVISITITDQTATGQLQWRGSVIMNGTGSVDSEGRVYLSGGSPDYLDELSGRLQPGNRRMTGRWRTVTLNQTTRGSYDISL